MLFTWSFDDVSWMDLTIPITIKVTKCKSWFFEHSISMSKWPTRSVYVGNIVYHLIYLPDPFVRGLEVDLEGKSIFPILLLSIHIDSLGLFYHLE